MHKMRLRFQIAISVFIAVLVGHTQTKPTDTGFVAGPAPAPALQYYGPFAANPALTSPETPIPELQESTSSAKVRAGRRQIIRSTLKAPMSGHSR
jgi:hypothetical protein